MILLVWTGRGLNDAPRQNIPYNSKSTQRKISKILNPFNLQSDLIITSPSIPSSQGLLPAPLGGGSKFSEAIAHRRVQCKFRARLRNATTGTLFNMTTYNVLLVKGEYTSILTGLILTGVFCTFTISKDRMKIIVECIPTCLIGILIGRDTWSKPFLHIFPTNKRCRSIASLQPTGGNSCVKLQMWRTVGSTLIKDSLCEAFLSYDGDIAISLHIVPSHLIRCRSRPSLFSWRRFFRPCSLQVLRRRISNLHLTLVSMEFSTLALVIIHPVAQPNSLVSPQFSA